MKKKVGLVIQGPLMSIGRTGNKLHQTPEELKRTGGVINYDCRENINKVIKEFGHLFDEIVISTWDNEVKERENFPGAKLISVPDPGGIKWDRQYKDNNKHRQFISTLNGLIELEKAGVDYAVKTRTDIYLDFKKLLDSFLENDTSKIGTTIAHPQNFLIHDLYFVAEFKKLKDFCEAILAYDKFEFISSVHREIILKPAYTLYRDKIGVPDWAYFPTFPPNGVCKETRKIFKYMFENIFFSLNPQVWKGTLWRDTHFSEDHFKNLLGNTRERKYNLPALITIDWQCYYAFAGQRLNISRKAKIWLGLLGSRLWNLARKVVRYFL